VSASPPWREVAPGVYHLGDGPDAIVERHPTTGEWHWRCPGIPAGGTAEDAGRAKRAARRALRKDEEGEG
jgi:hypothetical protein